MVMPMKQECLITDKVCSNSNKKCKECILDNCKGVIEMIDIQEKKKREIQIDRLKRQLPYKCQDCSLLEILNLEKGKVRCFYNVNGKCILK